MHIKRAFTLIELLVTIVIIGLLTTVATTSFLSAQRSSRDSARRTNLNAVANALEVYKTENQKYPGTVAQADVSGCSYIANQTYYYNPNVTTSNSCTGDYAPYPNWIPGLGKYLNPPVTERRYLGGSGSETAGGCFDSTTGQPTQSACGTSANYTRTYSYKRTTTGYNLYVGTEGAVCGSNQYYCVISK